MRFLEFKKVGFVIDESGTNEEECCRSVANGRNVVGAVRFLVNARTLRLELCKTIGLGPA